MAKFIYVARILQVKRTLIRSGQGKLIALNVNEFRH